MSSEDFTKNQVQDFETPLIQTPNPVEQIADAVSEDDTVKNDLAEAKEVAEKDDYHGIKTTLFRQPDTGEKFKIPAVFSPNPLAKNILSYLNNTGFVHILSIGQSGCLPLDEYVYTPNGIVQVKDVYDGLSILGGYVGGKYIFEDDVYEVKIGNTITFKATGEHPIWISKTGMNNRNPDNDSWVRVDELYKKFSGEKSNKWYAQKYGASNFKLNTISVGKNLAKLFGYLCSDGYWSNTQSIKFINVRQNLLDDVTSIAMELGQELNFSIKSYDKGNGKDLLLTNTRATQQNYLRNKMRELGIINRESFGQLQMLQEDELIDFIQGYFNGDGNLYVYSDKKYYDSVHLHFYVGIHKRQAYELQYMLWRLGVNSQISFRQRPNGIKGCWQVRISGQRSLNKMLKILDPRKYPEMFEKANRVLKTMKQTSHYQENNSEWLPITSVKKIGRQKVMAWQTLPSHEIISYMGLRTHNSGKTTWTKYLIHQLHELKNFQVHWHIRDEIQQLDKIIGNLQKGISHIIVLDDASFTLEELPKEKVNEIAKKLTYIRHEVKSDVVVIMNIHYSKAIKKFFRSVPFTYLTSINMEEVNSFQDVFGGYSRYKLRDFSRYYQQMMLKGKWIIDLDKWNNKVQTYFTDKPFRIALANELNYLHFFYYSKYSCDICDPEYNTKRVVDTQQMVNSVVEKYGKDRTRSMLFMYAFAKHGIKTMDSKRQSIWNTMADLDRNNPIDWKDVCAYLKKNMSKKRPRSYIKKNQYSKDYEDVKATGTRPQTPDELAVDTAIESDFSSELKKNFDEMESIADKSIITGDPTENQSFGDTEQIDFGNGLTDSDGFNPEETDE